MSLVKSSHTADDIAQEAFVRAWEKLPRLQNPKIFGSWLMTITRRCAIDWLRKHQRVNYTDSLDLTAAYEQNGRLDEDKEHLLAAIQKLPRAERQVIMLRYFGPCTVRDLADTVGRSVGTVTKQLSRAHHRLKSQLQES
jgi:RNA polymerase sigma-70 factor (ECF subfamily)